MIRAHPAFGRLFVAHRWAAFCLAALLVAVVGAWLLLLAAHHSDRFLVNHASGIWMALARYANEGLLYPPVAADGFYGGTRYMPLPVALYAAAALATDGYLASGKLLGHVEVVAAAALAVAAMRRSGASWALSLGLLAVVLASDTAVIAGHGLRQDALPLSLQLAAVVLVDRAPSRRNAAIAGVLCGLALTAKLTAVWGVAAIAIWLAARRDWRSLAAVAAAFAATTTIVFAVVQIASAGHFLENMLATAASTDVGIGSIISAPYRGVRLMTEHAIGVSHIMPFVAVVAAMAIRRARARPPSVYVIAWFASGVSLLGALTHPGAQWNHLVDFAFVSAIAAAGIVSATRKRLPGTLLAAVAVWATLVASSVHLVPPVLDAARQIRGGESQYLGEDLGELGQVLGASGSILSEDPGLPVHLDQDPVILDPYVFRSLAEARPDWARDLTRRVAAREFGAVVLVRDPTSADGREFYRDVDLGADVVNAVLDNYRLSTVTGGYHVFLPHAGAGSIRRAGAPPAGGAAVH